MPGEGFVCLSGRALKLSACLFACDLQETGPAPIESAGPAYFTLRELRPSPKLVLYAWAFARAALTASMNALLVVVAPATASTLAF